MEKLNLRQQNHAHTNQKKYTTTQNTQKTKARFSHTLRHPSRNWRELILTSAIINLSLTYLLKTLTHLLTAPDPHGTWRKTTEGNTANTGTSGKWMIKWTNVKNVGWFFLYITRMPSGTVH